MAVLKNNKNRYGKSRTLLGKEYNISKVKDRHWFCNGQAGRFFTIFFRNLKERPINFLKKIGKKSPDVIFLGAGSGYTICEFINFSKKSNIHSKVDVFSLTKSLSKDVVSKVRKDYSSNVAFEELNVKNSKYKFLENKYDLVVGAMSVGVHTNYPINSLFTSAVMLRLGGKAYVQLSLRKIYENLYPNRPVNWLHSDVHLSIQNIKNLLVSSNKIFNRMILAYNPNLKYSFKVVQNLGIYDAKTSFIEIERIK